MTKFKLCMTSIFLLSTISFVHAAQKQVQSNIQTPVNNITYEIKNVQQYGISDGYTLKQKNGVEEKVFVGTNHYKAQMLVNNNGKQAMINIMYSIRNPKITNSGETENTPSNIIIGEEMFNNNSNVDNHAVKNVSNQEIEKLQAIGISKEEFDREMKLHFKSVLYL